LKNVHSAIYGSAPSGLLDLLKHSLRALSREDLTLSPKGVYSWKNKENSPAFTVDFQYSFKRSVEKMQKMKVSQSWNNLNGCNGSGFKRRFVMLKELNTQEITPKFLETVFSA